MSQIEKWEAPKLWKYDENNEPSTNSGVVVVVTHEAHRKREEELLGVIRHIRDKERDARRYCCQDHTGYESIFSQEEFDSWSALLDAAKEEKHGTE